MIVYHRLRRVCALILILTALAGSSLGKAGNAHAGSDVPGTFENGYAGLCLDAATQTGTQSGGKVQVWACNFYSEQLWALRADGTLQNGYAGLCLDAGFHTARQNGGKVQLWACNGTPQQTWTLRANGSLQNGYAGLCLDAGFHTASQNGGKVQLWACNGTPQQTWMAHPLVNSTNAPDPSGGAPSLSVAYDRVTWSNLNPGNSGYSNPITVTNSGDAPLAIYGISIGGTDPSVFGETDTCDGKTLEPGGTCSISPTFQAPNQPCGKYGAEIDFHSNDDQFNDPIQLSGSTTDQNGDTCWLQEE